MLLRVLILLLIALLLFLALWLFLALLLLLLLLFLLGRQKIGVGGRHEGSVSVLAARGAHEATLDGLLDFFPIHGVHCKGGEVGLRTLVGGPVALGDQVHAAEVEPHKRRQHVRVPGFAAQFHGIP